jgi:uncharacterized protein
MHLFRYDGLAMSDNEFRDKWALVTGASAGIGVALARELSKHGAKLILTARRQDRLEKLAGEFSASGTETRILVADLNDPAAPQQIYDATEGAGITVDILINNAGLGQFGSFIEGNIEQEMSQVRVNCEAVVRLSRLFVPRMVERRRGWMLVVASTASYQPIPYLTTYAATKAFDRFFAQGLAAEVASQDVVVTTLCPGPTESEFFEISRSHVSDRHRQLAEEVAHLGIRGLERGKLTVIPNLTGHAGAMASRLLPVDFVVRTIEKIIRRRLRTG